MPFDSPIIRSRPVIERWVVVIAGVFQDEGKPTGMVALWAMLHHMVSGPTSRVELRSWNDDWNALAELIWRQRPAHDHLDVVICAYSRGGLSAMDFARQLGRRGINVRHMVLADPVYYRRWAPWRAIFRWSKIQVPRNVGPVTWFRQYRDWPAGHDLIAEDPSKTDIRPATVLERGHAYIDDAPEFHRACRAAVKGLEVPK